MKKVIFLAGVVLILLGTGCEKESTPQTVQKDTDITFQQREKCEELGSRYRKERESNAEGGSFFESTYGYSPKRNACLYVGGLIFGDSIQEYVIDLLTNEKVVQYMSFKGEAVIGGDQEALNFEKMRFKTELQNQFDIK